MAYVRRTWQERVGTLLNRFTKSSETTTSVVLVNDPGTITQAGTPFTAAAMNNIEDGIVEALAKVPTGVNNNVLLSNGAGKAKDSGKAIGNASGNVPLANGTKCVNLYGDMSDHLKQDEIATGAVRDIVGAHFTGHTTVKFLHVTELCTDNPSGARMTLEIHYYSADYIRVWAKTLHDKRTWTLFRDINGWQTGGTHNGWTQLTDASGNAINANSLGGVAAAFYTGYINTGASPSQSGSMMKGASYTAEHSGYIVFQAGSTGAGDFRFSVGSIRVLQGCVNTSTDDPTFCFPIKTGQTFRVDGSGVDGGYFWIYPTLA